MSSTIQVIKKSIRGMLWTKLGAGQLAMEILEEVNAGWDLIPSGAVKMTGER
jgi:hypothetical protein